MAHINTQAAGLAPAAITWQDGTASDTFTNTGEEILHIRNTAADGRTVTIVSPTPCRHGFSHDVVIAMAAGTIKAVGPFPVDRFGKTVTLLHPAVSEIDYAVVRA